MGRTGGIGHDDENGRSATTRIFSVLNTRKAAENIAASMAESTAEEIVLQLVVDDGVSNRGHRRNIFDPDLKFAAAGVAPHVVYGVVTVIDYAGDLL